MPILLVRMGILVQRKAHPRWEDGLLYIENLELAEIDCDCSIGTSSTRFIGNLNHLASFCYSSIVSPCETWISRLPIFLSCFSGYAFSIRCIGKLSISSIDLRPTSSSISLS